MSEINIDKFSNATKNIMYIIVLVGYAVLAYSQIYSNQSEIEQSKLDSKNEFIIQSERSDKRYKRAMMLGADHEERMRVLEKDIIYIKGKEGY